MNPREDIAYWKKRKTEVERAAKIVSQKREKTLYLYEVEKQSRRKARELQLRTLLEYETKELQQTQAGLQKINAKIIELEREQQKHSNVRMIGLLSLFIILFTFAGLVVYHHDGGNNALTGAVVGVQPEIDTHCHEEITCINETITTCTNETVQQCDSSCVNETKQTCVEECKPECHPEEINGVEREVCVKSCSEVCTEEVVQNCGSCVDVVEEKCSSEVVEQCSTLTVCDEHLDSGVTGDINADIVEKSPVVGIQPIVEEPIEVPGSEELIVQPIEEEIPSDEMTGGAISIPEEEPALEVPSVEEEASELDVQPIVEEPVKEIPEEETPSVELEEPSEEEIPEVTEPEAEPIETLPPEETEAEQEMPEEPVEEVAPVVEEEKSIFSSILDTIVDFIFPEDLVPLAINRFVLNTTYVTQGNGNVNLTAYTDGTDVKYTYNWLRNDTPIAVLHMTFDAASGTDAAHAKDYSGSRNIYNSSYQGITIGYVDAFNGSKGSFSVDSQRCNGAANTGEWDINGTSITNFDAIRDLLDLDAKTCVGAIDGYLGTGFLMYSKEDTLTRFPSYHTSCGANVCHRHFIVVNYSAGSGWRFDSNSAWTSFTPQETDALVAYVDSNTNVATELNFLPNWTGDGYNGSRGMRFNGSSDFVNLTDDPNFDFAVGQEFAISIWVKANSSGVTRDRK